jgi:L-ascorbate metabolism protein UlaG (beta-lactamase superfamily)
MMGRSIDELKAYARKHLKWFGQSAFKLAAGTGEVLFIDPFRVPSSAGPADMILITHPHGDHFDRRAVRGLRTGNTVIVVPQPSLESGLEGISWGQMIKVGDIGVTAVPAYNLGKPFHARDKKWVGYMIQADGLRIYHAGDTDLIPEMKDLKPDIALLPVGGLFGMNWKKAAEASGFLKAPLAIPMHYGSLIGGKKAGEKFSRMVGKGSLILKHEE